MTPTRSLALLVLAPALLAGCASSKAPAPPKIPAALQPPAGQTQHLETLATGVQVYECMLKADGSHDWIFKAPEATLASRAGQPLGKHYAGPTWEAPDGSTVVGEVKARDPGPTPTAIPWLLLAAKANTGAGTFASTKSIQRVATTGGVAPAEPCNTGTRGQVARVPYTATYYFFR
jgi:hypothetical protein